MSKPRDTVEIVTRVVEKADGPLQVGRADGVNCRTVEMFEAFGLAQKMVEVQDELGAEFGAKIAFVSITLDPEHDTPAVLTDYAQRWRADLGTWRFLTGAPDEIQKVAGHFGVVYWAEEGSITHTSSTAIVDREGRLAAVIEGSSFTSQQLIDLVTQSMSR